MKRTATLAGVPRWVAVIALAGAVFILLPLVAVISRVDWPQFIPLISSEESVAALLLSLRTAVASTFLCIVFNHNGNHIMFAAHQTKYLVKIWS